MHAQVPITLKITPISGKIQFDNHDINDYKPKF